MIFAAAFAVLPALGVACERDARPAPDEISAFALAPLDRSGFDLLPAAIVDLGPQPARPSLAAVDGPTAADLGSERSFAVGSTSHGYLVGGRPLSEDAHYLAARPIAVRRDAIYGTQELVGVLDRAAARVAARWPESVLYAGDLSARGGGDLPNHASHNNGRDVDLAFYVRDPNGRIADSPDFVRIGPDGRSSSGAVVFDAARNWALVEAFLRDPRVQVQWIFVAEHIEELIMAYARDASVEPALLKRAAAVLWQPRDSGDHAEHFHVRLYCAEAERLEGCVDRPPFHPWVDTHEQAVARRVGELLPLLESGGADEIRYAVLHLVRLRARGAVAAIEADSSHPDPAIRQLVTDAAAFLRGERTPPAWAYLTEGDERE